MNWIMDEMIANEFNVIVMLSNIFQFFLHYFQDNFERFYKKPTKMGHCTFQIVEKTKIHCHSKYFVKSTWNRRNFVKSIRNRSNFCENEISMAKIFTKITWNRSWSIHHFSRHNGSPLLAKNLRKITSQCETMARRKIFREIVLLRMSASRSNEIFREIDLDKSNSHTQSSSNLITLVTFDWPLCWQNLNSI